MSGIIKVNASEFGIEQTKASEIEKAFLPKIQERNGLSVIYSELLTKEINAGTSIAAGDLRKKLVKVRTGISSIHKTQKAFFLAAGKFCDAWKNKETEPILQMEENLSKIEKHAEILEQKRLSELQSERVNLLSVYLEDASERDLSNMENDVWDAYLQTKKTAYENAQAEILRLENERIEAEKAEKAGRERIRLENERLKKEAIERESKAKAEREKAEIEKKAIEAKAQEERENREAEQKRIENERLATEKKECEAREEIQRVEREKQAAILKAEREKLDKIEAELKAKKEDETKRLAEIESNKQTELNKGDSDKVNDLLTDLTELKSKYAFKSAKYKTKYTRVGLLIDKVIEDIRK